jgi:hypothetical protein
VVEPYESVWRAALPFLRARKNDVHVPLSYGFAERLLEGDVQADRDIVLLGILLHDVGWAVVDEVAIFEQGFGPEMMQSDVRIAHEKEGARLARELLEREVCPAATVDAVVAIIDGHDTRPHAISHEDELVKDADRLWRFTPTGVAIACDWWRQSPSTYADHLERDVLGGLFTAKALALAADELAGTRRALRLDLLADPD